ncbi:MAG: glycoside hydrolase family 2, partial [Cellulomonadaceae bacterium]|nr:glycoside hydrolase family 2 [Cellulomonadaceae bacterium]
MTSAPVTSPPALPRASEQGGTYPRPQLLRAQWADLTGPWDFAFDDDDAGRAAGWQREGRFDRVITVPFPPESPASGIGDPSPHRVLWYARDLDAADLRAAGHDAAPGNRLMLHFGAVDYRCQVWLDGQLVGSHQGGQTPFVLDVTELVGLVDGDGDGDGSVEPAARHRVVVRVEDDPADIAQPRGKQDWLEEPHVIWYHRTSGIWQTVWLESVPAVHVTEVFWRSDPAAGTVRAQLSLSRELAGERVRVVLDLAGRPLAAVEVTGYGSEVDVVVPVAALANGQSYEDVMWSPEHPRLVDARIEVGHDVVASYLGIRTVAVTRGLFLLNDRP